MLYLHKNLPKMVRLKLWFEATNIGLHLISLGKWFHNLGALTEYALSPYVLSFENTLSNKYCDECVHQCVYKVRDVDLAVSMLNS